MRAPAPIGFNPADPTLKFDLVIANADVMDPSQRLRTRADLAVKNGQIAAITPGIAADRAVQRIDGGDGCSPPASSTSTRISCRISASACPRTSW